MHFITTVYIHAAGLLLLHTRMKSFGALQEGKSPTANNDVAAANGFAKKKSHYTPPIHKHTHSHSLTPLSPPVSCEWETHFESALSVGHQTRLSAFSDVFTVRCVFWFFSPPSAWLPARRLALSCAMAASSGSLPRHARCQSKSEKLQMD